MEAWENECLDAWMLGCLEAWKHGDMETRKGRSIEAWKHGNIETLKHRSRESQGITWNHMYHLLHMEAWKYGSMESNGITKQSLLIVWSNNLQKLFVEMI